MNARALVAALALGVAPAAAQEVVQVANSDGAVLRGLDNITQNLTDIDLAVGDTVAFERLEITLLACRYPVDNPASDAFAHLTIRDVRDTDPRFSGWMVASSPALSALDHPRYDVWVLRCRIPAKPTSSDG